VAQDKCRGPSTKPHVPLVARLSGRQRSEFGQILEGRYVSTNFFANQTDRMQNFALMSNSETRLGEVTIPEGSTIFTGRGSGSTELRPNGRSQSDLPHGTT
jgi:hypothetical protein